MTERWYPDQSDHVVAAKAKEICLHECPVTLQCLIYSFVVRETHGIYGGLGESQRRRLRRSYRSMVETEELAGGMERFERLAEVTVDLLRQGIEPEWISDQNTSGATCGKISKWNRGCRCSSCKAASIAASYLRKVIPEDDVEAFLPQVLVDLDSLLNDFVPSASESGDEELQRLNDEAAKYESAAA